MQPGEKTGFLDSWDRPLDVAEGETWRDMTNGDYVKEKALKITMVVLAAIVAIGIAVAIYYCCTTTRMVTTGWHWGDWGNRVWDYVEVGNADLSAIPGVLGGIGVLALLIPVPFIDFSRGKGPKSDETIGEKEVRKNSLLSKTLKDIYQTNGSGASSWNKGLASLTADILTNEQNIELKNLDSAYHESTEILAEYSGATPTMIELMKSESGHRYTRALATLAILEGKWTELKKKIALNSLDEVTTKNPSYATDKNL